jgi:adenylate kinase family enzyme
VGEEVIILEGPDGSGKTTLGRRLSQIHGFPLVKREKQDAYLWVISELSSWSLSGLKIYDRFALVSEYIYGPLRRDGVQPEFDLKFPPTEEMMERFLQDALIIYCRPSVDTIIRNVKETTQPKDIEGITMGAITAYDEWFSHAPHYLFDYTSDSPESLSEIIHRHRVKWDRQ